MGISPLFIYIFIFTPCANILGSLRFKIIRHISTLEPCTVGQKIFFLIYSKIDEKVKPQPQGLQKCIHLIIHRVLLRSETPKTSDILLFYINFQNSLSLKALKILTQFFFCVIGLKVFFIFNVIQKLKVLYITHNLKKTYLFLKVSSGKIFFF